MTFQSFRSAAKETPLLKLSKPALLIQEILKNSPCHKAEGKL